MYPPKQETNDAEDEDIEDHRQAVQEDGQRSAAPGGVDAGRQEEHGGEAEHGGRSVPGTV